MTDISILLTYLVHYLYFILSLRSQGKSSGQYGRNITHGFLIRKKLSFWIFQVYEYKSIDNVFNFNQNSIYTLNICSISFHILLVSRAILNTKSIFLYISSPIQKSWENKAMCNVSSILSWWFPLSIQWWQTF
jgi:hypothetical protein